MNQQQALRFLQGQFPAANHPQFPAYPPLLPPGVPPPAIPIAGVPHPPGFPPLNPVYAAPPNPVVGHGAHAQGHHLQLTGDRNGILGRFKMNCPSKKSHLPDWMKKMRNAIRSARSGLRWQGVVNLIQGAPLHVDEIIPFSVVFSCPSAAALRIPVRNPANGMQMHLAPPADVLQELSTQVYTTVVNLIDYDNRTFYEGVAEYDGWELIRHLKTCQADEGGHYEMLQAQRAVLKKACPTLADYPTFRTACLQLKTDFDHAIRDQLISSDEDWSEKDAKNFACDILLPHLGRELALWNSDPSNVNSTLKEVFAKASSIYKVEVRQVSNAAASSSLLHSAPEPNFGAAEMYYQGQDQGRGGYHRKGKGKGKGGYEHGDRWDNTGTRRGDRWNNRRQYKGEKGGKGKGAFTSMLMPVIAAAVAQATSSYAQWPSASSSTRPPRRPDGYSHNDFRQQKRQRHRSEGVRQYVVTCDGNTEHWDAGDHDYDGDHHDYGYSDTQHNSTPDFASSSSDTFGSQSQ